MKSKINPFQPGNPVPPGTFAGRHIELEQVWRCLVQTTRNRSQNILVTGERGIGKTSVAYVIKALSEKKLGWDDTDPLAQAMLTAFVTVQKNSAPAVVLAEIIRELRRNLSSSKAKILETLQAFVDFCDEITIAGAGVKRGERELSQEEMYNKANDYIRSLTEKLWLNDKEPQRPVCIIIDEVDQLGDFSGFSSFWKGLQEKLAANDCRSLMLVMVGMPELKTQLSEDHPSLVRTFSPISLERMSDSDAREIINKSLERGSPRKTISPEGLQRILFYSENYPHLIQELGYSAYEVSQEEEISATDVEDGLNGTGLYPGSINRLGELFFSRMYDEVRRSENYKDLLRLISLESGLDQKWVTRQSILTQFSKKKSSLDAFLQSMVAKGVIIRNPDQQGEYRLVSKMFQVYISKILPQNQE